VTLGAPGVLAIEEARGAALHHGGPRPITTSPRFARRAG
jgi:hypothetical protein